MGNLNLGPAFLSFVIAALIAWLELITSKYPRTFFSIRKCRALYNYALVYGLIGFGAMLGLEQLINAGIIKLEGPFLSSLWTQSVIIGLTTKALLHIRLFNITVGSTTFPLGTESILHLFEPWLLEHIELHEFNAVREYIEIRARSYNNLLAVQQKIKSNLPQSFSGPERKSFEVDVDTKKSVVESMELYLRRFGSGSFNRVFP